MDYFAVISFQDYFAVISFQIAKNEPFWLVSQWVHQSSKSHTQYIPSVTAEVYGRREFRDKACAKDLLLCLAMTHHMRQLKSKIQSHANSFTTTPRGNIWYLELTFSQQLRVKKKKKSPIFLLTSKLCPTYAAVS